MISRKLAVRLVAASGLALSISGCALPPLVTAASFAVDIVSLGETGKTVSDHGLSLVMGQDCALLRAFQGAVCRDDAPGAETALGALIALGPLSDPSVNPAPDDPMILPPTLAYLDHPLGGAAARGAAVGNDLPAVAFAILREEIDAAEAAAARDGMAYLSAGIGG